MHRLLLMLVTAFATGCSTRPPPRVGPPSLGLDGPATYARYLTSLLPQAKMRHQVETRFGEHSEVVEGFFIFVRPDHFWVRALSPLGTTLFDVRSSAGEMEVDVRIEALEDARGPVYLARDIRRIYMRECPADAEVRPARTPRGGFSISCDLPADDAPIMADGGPDLPDDHLRTTISAGGVVVQKCFGRRGEKTACVDYQDYRQVGSTWLAHVIALEHAQVPYRLRIVLLEADPGFDAARVFGKSAQKSAEP